MDAVFEIGVGLPVEGVSRETSCRIKAGRESAGLRIMAGKSFVMLVLATMLGPAVGVGLFVLLNSY